MSTRLTYAEAGQEVQGGNEPFKDKNVRFPEEHPLWFERGGVSGRIWGDSGGQGNLGEDIGFFWFCNLKKNQHLEPQKGCWRKRSNF